jgi:hypothetical protein
MTPTSKPLTNVNPELAQRVQLLLAKLPTGYVSSAFRSLAEQTRLYNLFLAGKGSPANLPGTSMHEKGLAVDVACAASDDAARAKWAKEFGLYTPHSTELWHMELDPKRKSLDTGEAMPAQIMSCLVPSTKGYKGHWVLTKDGGVITFNKAPFYGSYPGLPSKDRLGKRSFTSIQATPEGGYVTFGDDGSYYTFNPK